jgi:hypothetical protein
MNAPRFRNGLAWLLQVVAAVILLQTLWFKFTGAPESRFIFSQLGVEPWGRILTGVLELITSLLLLNRRSAVFGALGAIGLMTGAVGSHLFRLGIAVQGDGGLLFALALTVLVCSAGVVFLRRGESTLLRLLFAPFGALACACHGGDSRATTDR